MKLNSSEFFANFSLADLVRKIDLRWNETGSGLVTGGIVGCGGGGGGVVFSQSKQGEFRCHRNESTSIRTQSWPGKFDAKLLLASLKDELAAEFGRRGIGIQEAAELDHTGFSFAYAEQEISGKVEISGRSGGDSYYSLQAKLEERSTSAKRPLVEMKLGQHEPTGNYYVVPFAKAEVPDAAQAFLERGQKAVQDSVARIQKRLISGMPNPESVVRDLQYVEVYAIGLSAWTAIPAEVKARFHELLGVEIEVPPEYENYQTVYFLNHVAVQMYRDIGAEFQILKGISDSEVPRVFGPSLSGPYLAPEERRRDTA